MAIYDNNGMTNYEIASLYDNDGATDYQISKVYDNDGTAEHLIYSAELVFYDNGMIIPWEKTIAGTYQKIQDEGSRIVMNAYNGGGCLGIWKADVTGFNTLEVTTTLGLSTSGYHKISATPHSPSDPFNPSWDFSTSSYRGKATGELYGTGVWTLDVSNLNGTMYFAICANGRTTGSRYYDVYVNKFRLY